MNDLWLVAVGAGRWQLSGIRAAQAEGIRVLGLDASAEALGAGIVDRFEMVDIRDSEKVLRAVEATGIRPSGAVSLVTDAGMMAAAALRDAYDLPGPRPSVAAALVNKERQRQAWSAHGLPCPRWASVGTLSEAATEFEQHRGTVIVKPVDSAGSRGITVIEAGESWCEAVQLAINASHSRRAIIENYIVGTEYTVESFAERGRTSILAVSEKRKVPGTRGTVAVELATPDLPDADIRSIGDLARAALDTLGHTDGPGHTEILRRDDGSLWLVETAGRGGGFMVADGIVLRAAGLDLAMATVRQAVGRRPPPVRRRDARSFVLRFLPTRPGIVSSWQGFEAARALGNVECEPLVAVGERVGSARTDAARLAYVLTWADGRSAAIELADRAEGLLDFAIG